MEACNLREIEKDGELRMGNCARTRARKHISVGTRQWVIYKSELKQTFRTCFSITRWKLNTKYISCGPLCLNHMFYNTDCSLLNTRSLVNKIDFLIFIWVWQPRLALHHCKLVKFEHLQLRYCGWLALLFTPVGSCWLWARESAIWLGAIW